MFLDIEPQEPQVVASSRAETAQLEWKLEEQRAKTRELWRLNCEQLAEMDETLVEKDQEITGGPVHQKCQRVPQLGVEVRTHHLA